MPTSYRAYRFLEWGCLTFGSAVVLDHRERAMRFIEEAVELVHALQLDEHTLASIVKRVYTNPTGSIKREFGQCLATLELLALVNNVDIDSEATAELNRVRQIPKSEWQKRQAGKVRLGIATGELRVCQNPECGKDISHKPKSAKFCSRTCYGRASRRGISGARVPHGKYERNSAILVLYKAGKPLSEISEQFGISKARVGQIVKHHEGDV